MNTVPDQFSINLSGQALKHTGRLDSRQIEALRQRGMRLRSQAFTRFWLNLGRAIQHRLQHWRKQRHERRVLAQLSALNWRELRDLGLSRNDLDRLRQHVVDSAELQREREQATAGRRHINRQFRPKLVAVNNSATPRQSRPALKKSA